MKKFVQNMYQNRKIYKCLIILNTCLKMLNIIKKGYKDILSLLKEEKELHLRDIAKKTKLNENSTYRFLNKLEKENILKSKKLGNLKFFSYKNNKQSYQIKSFFDIEKYEKLPHIRKTAINYYLNSLPKKPIYVLLFGSTAKNTYRTDSDIDILLITNEKIDTSNSEKIADSQSAIKISTFQITYKNFIQELKLKNDFVIQSAIETGYPIINHVDYYEVLDNERI